MKFSLKNKGFTLIEILVTVSIIAVLSGIIFASFDDARKQSRDKIRMSSLKELQLAIELYKSQNGMYPQKGCAATQDWVGPGSASGILNSTNDCEQYIVGLTPDYIPVLPRDPLSEGVNNKGFFYWTNTNRSQYKVLVYDSVEAVTITSFTDQFARCPYACSSTSYCNNLLNLEKNVYAVYSLGAECQ